MIWPISSSSTIVPLHANSFLNALRSFLGSYSGQIKRTLGQALERRQRLTAITLLDANVHVVVALSSFLSLLSGLCDGNLLTDVGKRVWSERTHRSLQGSGCS